MLSCLGDSLPEDRFLDGNCVKLIEHLRMYHPSLVASRHSGLVRPRQTVSAHTKDSQQLCTPHLPDILDLSNHVCDGLLKQVWLNFVLVWGGLLGVRRVDLHVSATGRSLPTAVAQDLNKTNPTQKWGAHQEDVVVRQL